MFFFYFYAVDVLYTIYYFEVSGNFCYQSYEWRQENNALISKSYRFLVDVVKFEWDATRALEFH